MSENCTHDCSSCSADCSSRDMRVPANAMSSIKRVIAVVSGKGGVVNTIVGVLIMTVLDNGLVMLNVNPNIRTGVQGVIILVAVILTAARGAKVISK